MTLPIPNADLLSNVEFTLDEETLAPTAGRTLTLRAGAPGVEFTSSLGPVCRISHTGAKLSALSIMPHTVRNGPAAGEDTKVVTFSLLDINDVLEVNTGDQWISAVEWLATVAAAQDFSKTPSGKVLDADFWEEKITGALNLLPTNGPRMMLCQHFRPSEDSIHTIACLGSAYGVVPRRLETEGRRPIEAQWRFGTVLNRGINVVEFQMGSIRDRAVSQRSQGFLDPLTALWENFQIRLYAASQFAAYDAKIRELGSAATPEDRAARRDLSSARTTFATNIGGAQYRTTVMPDQSLQVDYTTVDGVNVPCGQLTLMVESDIADEIIGMKREFYDISETQARVMLGINSHVDLDTAEDVKVTVNFWTTVSDGNEPMSSSGVSDLAEIQMNAPGSNPAASTMVDW